MRKKQKKKEKQNRITEQVIKKRLEKVRIRQEYESLLLRTGITLLIFWLLFTQVFFITRASGNDMFPAVKDGDVLLAWRLEKNYAKNDVILYEINGEIRTGRVLACGGDVVTLDDSGIVLVNGTAQSGEILYPTYADQDTEYPYRVPEGYVFVLGDYRTEASDSRKLGPIPFQAVKGTVITILRRRGI